ncbi:sulfurtransferase [Ramlibacter sp. 2FC]|uniref:sulfurtransferase n=1 Tax=Ramlibacter sp. 2FC TaxID=2502188 RepID=UPI0010F57D13|nr:sulfurtransferase [Ramlibacter sp. 2FC]
MYDTLISVAQLQALQAGGKPLMVFDCSFDLMNPAAADALFAHAHVAGAVQAHLERDLSAHDAAEAVNGGRHPLPRREAFAAWLSRVGFANDMQAVVYDRNGCNYCGRLWWMLKWAGHEAVAVLDGGLQAWEAAGGAVENGPGAERAAGQFSLALERRMLASTSRVAEQLGRPAQTLIDARGAARYRGEMEPLDPVAGHIPGALNRPFQDNFQPDGRFKPAGQLKAEFEALLAGRAPTTVVHHCGSGVSAIPNLLAMEVAGLGPTALYAGSWSEWCRAPGLPCAQG